MEGFLLRGQGLHLKTTTCRGGVIKNVRFERNIVHKNFSCISLITDYQMTQAALDRCSPTTVSERSPVCLPPFQLQLVDSQFTGMLLSVRAHKGYPATVIHNISWIGNTCGSGSGSWGCSVNDTCTNITVAQNTFPPATSYHCKYIRSFHVAGNSPPGLEQCMEHAMRPSPPPPRAHALEGHF